MTGLATLIKRVRLEVPDMLPDIRACLAASEACIRDPCYETVGKARVAADGAYNVARSELVNSVNAGHPGRHVAAVQLAIGAAEMTARTAAWVSKGKVEAKYAATRGVLWEDAEEIVRLCALHATKTANIAVSYLDHLEKMLVEEM